MGSLSPSEVEAWNLISHTYEGEEGETKHVAIRGTEAGDGKREDSTTGYKK